MVTEHPLHRSITERQGEKRKHARPDRKGARQEEDHRAEQAEHDGQRNDAKGRFDAEHDDKRMLSGLTVRVQVGELSDSDQGKNGEPDRCAQDPNQG